MSSHFIPDMACVGWVSGLSTEPQQMEAGPGDEVKMSRETQAKVVALRYIYIRLNYSAIFSTNTLLITGTLRDSFNVMSLHIRKKYY